MLLTKDIYKVKLYGKWKMKRCVKIYHVIANKESNGGNISTRSTEQNLMSKAVNGSRRIVYAETYSPPGLCNIYTLLSTEQHQ